MVGAAQHNRESQRCLSPQKPAYPLGLRGHYPPMYFVDAVSAVGCNLPFGPAANRCFFWPAGDSNTGRGPGVSGASRICLFFLFFCSFSFSRFAQAESVGPFATFLFASRGDCSTSGTVQVTGFGAFSAGVLGMPVNVPRMCILRWPASVLHPLFSAVAKKVPHG